MSFLLQSMQKVNKCDLFICTIKTVCVNATCLHVELGRHVHDIWRSSGKTLRTPLLDNGIVEAAERLMLRQVSWSHCRTDKGIMTQRKRRGQIEYQHHLLTLFYYNYKIYKTKNYNISTYYPMEKWTSATFAFSESVSKHVTTREPGVFRNVPGLWIPIGVEPKSSPWL